MNTRALSVPPSFFFILRNTKTYKTAISFPSPATHLLLTTTIKQHGQDSSIQGGSEKLKRTYYVGCRKLQGEADILTRVSSYTGPCLATALLSSIAPLKLQNESTYQSLPLISISVLSIYTFWPLSRQKYIFDPWLAEPVFYCYSLVGPWSD